MVSSTQSENTGAVASMLTTNLRRMIINPGYTLRLRRMTALVNSTEQHSADWEPNTLALDIRPGEGCAEGKATTHWARTAAPCPRCGLPQTFPSRRELAAERWADALEAEPCSMRGYRDWKDRHRPLRLPQFVERSGAVSNWSSL